MNRFKKLHTLFGILAAVIMFSCDELIEVDNPRTQLIKSTIFEDDITAQAAVAGLYTRFSSNAGSYSSITYLASLSADEATLVNNALDEQFYDNAIVETNSRVQDVWSGSYERIYLANSIIEGLHNSRITTALKNQLTGEALFLRAFSHFYLVNIFGDVPYITTTDYEENGTASRETVSTVYEKLIKDVIDAHDLLANDYSYSNGERVRVNRWVANAFLARVYLFNGNWQAAEDLATAVIESSEIFDLVELTDVFLKNSKETIWQLMPISTQKYTNDAGVFYRPSYASGYPVLTQWQFDAFDDDDARKTAWVKSGSSGALTWHYPVKYREVQATATGAEYSTVIRLAELYLIRAEARVRLGKLTGAGSATEDINVIRDRAGLPETEASSETDLLRAIDQERRAELFTEWGHRWLDLKRTNRAATVLEPIKAGWQDTDILYPIPQAERLLNPNLDKNPGY
jgi:hypothetical protein